MNLSDRIGPIYVALGPSASRRRVQRHGAAAAPVERFLGRRMHGFSTVVWIERGRGSVHGSFGRLDVEAGDVLLLPPGLVANAFVGPRRVDVLALGTSVTAGGIVRANELPRELFERDARTVVAALLAAPARHRFERSSIERTAMRALSRIEERPATARLASIAHDLGYTSDGLSRVLHRITGRGFARWRDALSMAHVRARLVEGESVVRAARSMGLDATYLHRRFALAHRSTPRQWLADPGLPVDATAHTWDELVRRFET